MQEGRGLPSGRSAGESKITQTLRQVGRTSPLGCTEQRLAHMGTLTSGRREAGNPTGPAQDSFMLRGNSPE